MGIRTGREFIQSVRDERTVYVGGERVFSSVNGKAALRPPPFPAYGVSGDGDEEDDLDQVR